MNDQLNKKMDALSLGERMVRVARLAAIRHIELELKSAQDEPAKHDNPNIISSFPFADLTQMGQVDVARQFVGQVAGQSAASFDPIVSETLTRLSSESRVPGSEKSPSDKRAA